MTESLQNSTNNQFSISILNRIPKTMREKIPGYELLSRPVPGLDFLDQSIAPEIKAFQSKLRQARASRRPEQTAPEEQLHPAGPMVLHGDLMRGKDTPYAIDHVDFAMDNNTMIVGHPAVGRHAKVTIKPFPSGGWRAVSISVDN